MQDFIKLSNHLADEAGQIIRQYFRQPFDVEQKGDSSPVTIADKSVEQRLRAIIEEKRPDDGIIGEEFDDKEAKNQYTWVFDPIDGTKSFVMGRPTFGTLIALCENGVPILGVIDQPILNERWIGAKDHKTTFNGKDVQTVKCKDLSNARICSTTPIMLKPSWEKLEEQSQFMSWGGDCYAYGLLSMGGLDAVVETLLGTHDYCALAPIVNGAGGHMCDWNGNQLTIDSDGRTLAVGDIALKDQILDIVQN